MGWLQASLCSRSHRNPTSENPLVRVLNHKTRILVFGESGRERRGGEEREGGREEGRKGKRAVLFR